MSNGGERRIWAALEDLFILLSILALWPVILGWEGWVWVILKYLAVAGLVWIFARRVRRYQRRAKVDDSETG